MRELERDLPTPPAHAASLPPLAIVGAGRVGSSLAAAAASGGIDAALADRRGALSAAAGAQALLLCVPDGEIEAAAASLAERLARAPMLVGHVSGASTLAPLAPLRERGAEAFSLHPLQTVPDAETDFTASPAAIAGSSRAALDFARRLAERLGMIPFEVPEERRAAYHAAASIASNFLVALEESAAQLLEASGVDAARALLAPLVLRSAANWSERGPAALTGPIARGDEATVARHLEELRSTAPDLVPLYEALAERTRELAGRRR